MPSTLEEIGRLLVALAAAVLTGWWLSHRGWPLISWLPAALLAPLAVGVVWVMVWYVRRKLTYEAQARRTKADLQAGGDGWPERRRHRDHQ